MRSISGSVLLLLALSGGAAALMPPQVYREAREKAAYHVQVDITKVEAPRTGPGGCAVEGQVLKIFKNANDKLAKDEVIAFPVACKRQGDKVPIGGTMWLDTDALEKADYIEVYLNDSADGFEPALWNYKLISALSEAPQLPIE